MKAMMIMTVLAAGPVAAQSPDYVKTISEVACGDVFGSSDPITIGYLNSFVAGMSVAMANIAAENPSLAEIDGIYSTTWKTLAKGCVDVGETATITDLSHEIANQYGKWIRNR